MGVTLWANNLALPPNAGILCVLEPGCQGARSHGAPHGADLLPGGAGAPALTRSGSGLSSPADQEAELQLVVGVAAEVWR